MATARTLIKEGDTMFVALSWSDHGAPTTYEDAYDRLVWTAHHWQHWLDHGTFPDHPWRTHLQRAALTLKGLSYSPTGALVAAATTSLPGDPGRGAQLGLPLQLDPRLHLHALGSLHARLRLGGERLLLLHRGHRGPGGGRPPDHVPDRRRRRDPRVHARPPVGLRGCEAGASGQQRLQAGAARRLGRAARLDLPAHQVAQLPAGPDLADREGAGRARAREVARAGSRASGRSAASRGTSPRRR